MKLAKPALTASLFLLLTSLGFQATGQGMLSSKPRDYTKNNILSIAFVQFTNDGLIGVGLHYERFLDEGKIVSFYLPLVLNFPETKLLYNSGGNNTPENKTGFLFNAFPGVKIYPTGANGVVRYSIGPSIGIMNGHRYYYDVATNDIVKYDVNRLGLMINNGVNINPSSKLYLGLELGLGFYYKNSDKKLDYIYGLADEPRIMAQFNLKAGFRF